MVGGPIEVKRPLVALKISGSSGDAKCLISHVATGVVEIQMMKRAYMASTPDVPRIGSIGIERPVRWAATALRVDLRQARRMRQHRRGDGLAAWEGHDGR